MRTTILAPLAVASLLISGTASAETRPIEVPNRYLVIPPSESVSKHLRPGDVVIDVPLRWKSAAILGRQVEVTADDRRLSLRQGQALVEMRLQFDDPKFAQAISFCVPRLADPIRKSPLLAFGVIGAVLARSTTDGQFCLVDSNRDGLADNSVLVNAGSPAARTPVSISPAPYVLETGAAVSEGDSFSITYSGRNSFEIAIVQQGKARRFDSLSFSGPSGRSSFNRFLRTVKMPDGSVRVPAPGVVFTVTKYDKADKSSEIIWPAISEPVILPIPDDVKTGYGFGY